MRGRKPSAIASTWWTEHWHAALAAMASDWASRLTRGRSYARGDRVRDLTIEPGHISARVQGTRPTPYRVDIRLPLLDDGVWRSALSLIAQRAGLLGAMLSGDLPRGVQAAFATAGASLFPTPDVRIAVSCSCPDWARPCKHAAAVFYAVGQAMERDPFVLLTLRGRTRDEILAALRARRSDIATSADDRPVDGLTAPPSQREALHAALASYWSSPSDAALALHVEVDLEEHNALRRLGPPPPGLSGRELRHELEIAYQILAERARAALSADRRAPSDNGSVER